MNDFVTIATYDDYLSAHFDLRKLEHEEIPCYLADENTVTTQWILNNALGGIKLRVRESDAQEARRILAEKLKEIEADYEIDSKGPELTCINCGSNNTATEKFSRSVVGLSWLFLGFPVPFRFKKDNRCFACGHKWKS
jgi:hypothetical protein